MHVHRNKLSVRWIPITFVSRNVATVLIELLILRLITTGFHHLTFDYSQNEFMYRLFKIADQTSSPFIDEIPLDPPLPISALFARDIHDNLLTLPLQYSI